MLIDGLLIIFHAVLKIIRIKSDVFNLIEMKKTYFLQKKDNLLAHFLTIRFNDVFRFDEINWHFFDSLKIFGRKYLFIIFKYLLFDI